MIGESIMVRFGPAGTPLSFHQKGFRTQLQIPEYLKEFSLNAFEYQCGRGVRISQESAQALKEAAKPYNIQLSVHAPYYISLSSTDPQKRENSIDYIEKTAIAAAAMGAERIVVHSGSCASISRQAALELAKETLKKAQQRLDEKQLSQIHICPETMGKVNQLGDLKEVLELCKVDERLIPCIDFGHLNARSFGGIQSQSDYISILNEIEQQLGKERLRFFHAHFSKIEYTKTGGEKQHLTFSDIVYGPEFEPLVELIAKRKLSPTFICESAGTQAEDAQFMREQYLYYCSQE